MGDKHISDDFTLLLSEVDLQENISTQVSRAVERNNACQIGNRCAKMGGGGGVGEGGATRKMWRQQR